MIKQKLNNIELFLVTKSTKFKILKFIFLSLSTILFSFGILFVKDTNFSESFINRKIFLIFLILFFYSLFLIFSNYFLLPLYKKLYEKFNFLKINLEEYKKLLLFCFKKNNINYKYIMEQLLNENLLTFSIGGDVDNLYSNPLSGTIKSNMGEETYNSFNNDLTKLIKEFDNNKSISYTEEEYLKDKFLEKEKEKEYLRKEEEKRIKEETEKKNIINEYDIIDKKINSKDIFLNKILNERKIEVVNLVKNN